MSVTQTLPYTSGTEVKMPDLDDVVTFLDKQIADGKADEQIMMNDHQRCLGAQTVLWLNPQYAVGHVSYSWQDARFNRDGAEDWGLPVEAGIGVGDALQHLAQYNQYPTFQEAREYIVGWQNGNAPEPVDEDDWDDDDEDEDEE